MWRGSVAGVAALADAERGVDHGGNEPVARRGGAEMAARMPRQPAPEASFGKFQGGAGGLGGVEEFDRERAQLQRATQPAAVARFALLRLLRRTPHYPIGATLRPRSAIINNRDGCRTLRSLGAAFRRVTGLAGRSVPWPGRGLDQPAQFALA